MRFEGEGMSEKTREDGSSLSDLKPLVRKLVKVKKQAEAIGLFTHDRELRECTCGLIEDVAFDGSPGESAGVRFHGIVPR